MVAAMVTLILIWSALLYVAFLHATLKALGLCSRPTPKP